MKAGPTNKDLLAEFTKVIHKTTELQDKQRNDLIETESILSPPHEPPSLRGQKPNSAWKENTTLDVDNLRHTIKAAQARNQGASIRDRLGFRPDLRDHLRAHTMERYRLDYEAPIPRLTSGIALACFGYEVINH